MLMQGFLEDFGYMKTQGLIMLSILYTKWIPLVTLVV